MKQRRSRIQSDSDDSSRSRSRDRGNQTTSKRNASRYKAWKNEEEKKSLNKTIKEHNRDNYGTKRAHWSAIAESHNEKYCKRRNFERNWEQIKYYMNKVHSLNK